MLLTLELPELALQLPIWGQSGIICTKLYRTAQDFPFAAQDHL